MKRRFEQNQQDCVFTVLSLLPTLGDQLLHELNVELITAKLQQSRSQRSTPAPTPESSTILPAKPEQPAAKNTNDTGSTESDPTKKEDAEAETIVNGKDGHDSDTGATVNGDTKSETGSEDTIQDVAKADGSAPHAEPEEVQKSVQASEPTTEEPQQQQQQLQEAAAAVVQPIPRDEAAVAIDRRTKLELWNELKVMSLTRTVTALYSVTMLTLLTQLQLNLLGRFTYVSSVVALANPTDASFRVESPAVKGSYTSTNGQLNFQTEKKFLTFSYWLLHEGWRRWSDRVREVVEDIIGGVSLKKTFNAKEFTELLSEIRERLEYTEVDGEKVPANMREYMLPDEPADEREVLRAGGVDEFDLYVDPVLRSLLDETRDFIDSDDFSTVLASTLGATFARFNLALQPTFNPFLLSPPRSGSTIEEIEDEDDVDRSVPFASLLPVISRQVHLIINGVPNEYVDSLSLVKDLQVFSAIVYSSYGEQFSQ
ncbi:peroxin, partial [Lunasporangiospora selenospora]